MKIDTEKQQWRVFYAVDGAVRALDSACLAADQVYDVRYSDLGAALRKVAEELDEIMQDMIQSKYNNNGQFIA